MVPIPSIWIDLADLGGSSMFQLSGPYSVAGRERCATAEVEQCRGPGGPEGPRGPRGPRFSATGWEMMGDVHHEGPQRDFQ